MTRRVYFTGPGDVAVRVEPVDDPGPGELRVDTEVSAISPGTELLVYRGQVREGLPADETIDALSGSLSYPLSYGYAAVGTVVEAGAGVDDGWLGETVFAFHPHAGEFVAPVDDVSPVPEGLDPATAALLPNVETAVNFLLDGSPRVGERAVVFGQGVVGLLTTALLSAAPLSELVTVDCYETRRRLSASLGADRSVEPAAVEEVVRGWTADGGAGPAGPAAPTDDGPDRADLTFELSGNPDALDAAIDVTGYGGRIVVGSWYGTERAELGLDGRFHRSRIELVSSQVSTVAPERRGRWTKGRRLATAWRRLAEIETDPLVTHRMDVGDAPRAYDLLDEHPEEAVQVLLTYD
jgi:2-desacetyl-2-hydroxyethyl bacteriochlorophyllide A dehydrogenase